MGSTGLDRSFSRFIGHHRLIQPSEMVVAAVSGGLDSMVMLHLLEGLRREIPFDLSVAHVNHGLRGSESDGDEELVRRTAAGFGLELHLHRWTGHSGTGAKAPGIQERARDERYRFFESLRGTGPRTRLATAHHRDDNAETVLFNFLRGSGIAGLAGIPVERSDGFIIRPLLFATRAEILAFAAERGIAYREDSSNAAISYTRNALRLRLMPEIESLVNPGIRDTLSRTSSLFTDLDAYVSAEVERLLPGIVESETGTQFRLHAGRLKELPPFLRESVLLAVCRKFHPSGVGFVHIRALLGLLDARTGSSCRILEHLHVSREREFLVLRDRAEAWEPFDLPVRPGDEYRFGEFSFSSSPTTEVHLGRSPDEEYVDADLLGDDLRLRSWTDGDWFIPFGMQARKKLSDFFVDRKIPLAEKRTIPLLVSGDSIAWVCGVRLDNRFRIGPHTERVLRLRYERARG